MAEIVCVARPLVPNDLRISRFFETIEEHLKGDRIEYVERGWKWNGPIQNRTELVNSWLPRATGKLSPQLFGNGKRGTRQIIAGIHNILLGPGASEVISEYRVNVGDKSELFSQWPELLKALAVAVDADYGWASSMKCSEQISRTEEDFIRYPEYANIKNYKAYALRRRELKGRVGSGSFGTMTLSWLNYFGNATAKSLSFPDPAHDQLLSGNYERVENEGWLLRLTEEPLDLDNGSHLERTQWAFDRFSRES